MSTDWREKEREFLTSLKADTGRDLGEWMRIIAAQNLPHRNDIIDWLRQRGFPFARASWLERIHHNQGRPIYLDPSDLMPQAAQGEADIEAEGGMQRIAVGGNRGAVFVAAPTPTSAACQQPPAPAPAPARTTPPPRIAARTPDPPGLQNEVRVGGAPDGVATRKASDTPPVLPGEHDPAGAQKTLQAQSSIPAAPSPSTLPEAGQSGGAATSPAYLMPTTGAQALAIEDVLAKAKAYRPLALHLKRMIEAAVANLEIAPGPGHLLLSTRNTPFAVMAISGKDIRLALRLEAGVAHAPLVPVKLAVTLARAAQGMTHMAVLTDARQLDDELINLIRCAAHG